MKAGHLYGPSHGYWPDKRNCHVREDAGFADYIQMNLATLQRPSTASDVLRLHVHLEILAYEEWGRGNDQQWARNRLMANAILEPEGCIFHCLWMPQGWRSYFSNKHPTTRSK